MIIDFEKICKECGEDSRAVKMHVNAVREYIDFLYKDNIATIRDFIDLPFPDMDKVRFHLGVCQGITYFSLLSGYLNEDEFREYLSQITFIYQNKILPEELYKIKPW